MKQLTLKILRPPRFKCAHCGREFYYKVAHKCNGNFRKRHLKWIELLNDKEAMADLLTTTISLKTETHIDKGVVIDRLEELNDALESQQYKSGYLISKYGKLKL